MALFQGPSRAIALGLDLGEVGLGAASEDLGPPPFPRHAEEAQDHGQDQGCREAGHDRPAPALPPADPDRPHGASEHRLAVEPSAEVGREGIGAGVAMGRLLGHRLQADGLQILGDGIIEAARRARVLLADPRQQHLARPRERPRAGQELVEDGAQAVDVRAGVELRRLAPRLLGGHVGRRADHPAVEGERRLGAAALGQPEIGEIDSVVAVDQDIRRLNVAVDDAQAVRVPQGLGQRGDPFDRSTKSRAADRQLVGEVAALDQGGDQVQLAISLAGIIDRDDVGMVQDGRAARLAEEPADGLGSLHRPGPGPFQGHVAAERGVPGPVHDAEGTPADHVPEFIAADARRGPRRDAGPIGDR